MTSNFNTNQKSREYSYKSQLFEEYPTVNLTSVNYDTESSLQENNNVISPRMMQTMRRMNAQSFRSGTMNENSTKSKDEFAIFGSFIRQKSERRDENEYKNSSFNRTRTTPRQDYMFKNLPVKSQEGSESNSVEYSQIFKTENSSKLQSQPRYMSQSDTSPDSTFDLIKSRDEVDLTSLPRVSSPDFIVPLRKTQIESAPMQTSAQDSDIKDKEIVRLNKSVERMNKKLLILEDNNKRLQDHLKNLLDERKQLLNQIENSEFEEIIEEEEIQKAKPNSAPRENVMRIEYVKEETPKISEVSHMYCLQRGKITLDDVPQRMLESFRNDILRREKEIMETEKRSLVEHLKVQHERQLHSLQAEYQAQKMATQHVSVQSYKKTQFNHIVSETNLQKTSPPKPLSNEVSVNALPTVLNKQCQYESNQARSSLNNYVTKSNITKRQKTIIEKVIQSVENNDYEGLINTLDEALSKSVTTVGINATPAYSSKSSNTLSTNKADVMVEANIVVEDVKPRISQESRAILVKPLLTQRGCQPDDTFKFETGTMTDQVFCRSQGMMTTGDYTDNRPSSSLEVESVINRSTNRSESRKQTISHTSYLTSPTKEFISIHERSLSPRISKISQKTPNETVVENIVEVKTIKNDKMPNSKPVDVIEEIEHIIEKKTQQVTSVLDSNKVPKKEVPTTIECWETISHVKDGQIIDETETYHDRLVSTDVEEIKAHLTKHEQCKSNESSPTKKNATENPIISPLSNFIEENIKESSINFKEMKSKFEINAKSGEVMPNKRLFSPSMSSAIKEKNLSSQDSMSSNNSLGYTRNININKEQSKFLSEYIKKPITLKEVKVQQSISKPLLKETVFRESEQTFNRSDLQRTTLTKDTIFSQSTTKDGTHQESGDVMDSSSLRKPLEVKEIKSENNIPISLKEATFDESEIANLKKQTEFKEIKVQKICSTTPLNEADHQKKQEIIDFTSLRRPLEVKEITVTQNVTKPLLKETIVDEREQIITFGNSGKVTDMKETKIQQTFLATPFIKPTHFDSERSLKSGNFSTNNDVKEIKVQRNPSSNTSKETSVLPGSIKTSLENKEIRVQESVLKPSVKETTYQESEEIITTTTISSRLPIEFTSVNSTRDNFQTMNFSKTKAPSPNSIGVLTSPTSFQPYSSSKARSSFLTNKKETFSFESTEGLTKSQTIPIEVKTTSSEFSTYNIPLNNVSFVSGHNKVTRLPINIKSNVSGSSSITSNNSAFRSLSSNQESEKMSKISVTKESVKPDYSEVLLSESVFQGCSELLLWLKSLSVVTTSTVTHLPPNLITVSSTLIDWWVDITMKVDAAQLLAIINYLISTFSKNLLKYLIINLDQQGNSCLHYLIGHQIWNSYDVLDSTNLVDPDVFNTQGFTLLMVACTVKVISDSDRSKLRKLASNATVNLKSKIQGQTANFIAAFHNNCQTIELLYTLGADINIPDNNDVTPLMIACSNNNIDAVRTIMLLPGVLTNLKNKNGKTALEIAEESNFTDILEIFHQRSSQNVSESSSYSRVTQNSYSNSSYGGSWKH